MTRIEDLHEKADVVSSLNIVIQFKKNTKEGSYYKMILSNSLFFFSLCSGSPIQYQRVITSGKFCLFYLGASGKFKAAIATVNEK